MEFIMSITNHSEVSEELKSKLIEYDYTKLSDLGKSNNENLALFFYSQGGFDSLKRIFKLKAYTLNFRSGKVNFTLFIHLLLNEKNKNLDVLQEGFVKNNFARILIKRINNHLVELFNTKNDQDTLEDKTEVLSYYL